MLQLDKRSAYKCAGYAFLSFFILNIAFSFIYKEIGMRHFKNEIQSEIQLLHNHINTHTDTHLSDNIDDFFSGRLSYVTKIKLYEPNGRILTLYNDDRKRASETFITSTLPQNKSSTIRVFGDQDRIDRITVVQILILANGALIGLVAGLFGYFSNIARQTRTRLQDTQIFTKTIMDNLPSSLFVKDKDFRIIEGNRHFLSLFPKDMRDNVIGRTLVEDFDEEESKAFLAEDKKAFDFGYSKTVETLHFPDGEIKTFSTQKARFEDEKHQQFILGIATDITEQIAIQKDLEKSQAFLRMIIDYFPGLLFVKDSESKVIFANDRFKAMYPEDKQDKIIGYTTFEDYPYDQRKSFLKQDQEAFRTGYVEVLTTITYPNGEKKDVTAKKVCFADNDGNQYLLCVIIDNIEKEA